jgi:hypothetical protein
MGGQINMAFRFSDGEAVCFDRWTNNVKWNLAKPELLQGDEQVVLDYIAMTRNNDFIVDPHYNGRPVRLSTSGYGLILIDFQTKTIIDVNGYTALFNSFSPFLMMRPVKPKGFRSKIDFMSYKDDYEALREAEKAERADWKYEWSEDHGEQFKPFLDANMRVFRYDWRTKQKTFYQGAEAIPVIETDAREDHAGVQWGVDVESLGWTYFNRLDGHDDKRAALAKAREIKFPFTRAEGLNRTAPPPKSRGKNTKPEEIKARYLFMKMKEMPEFKHLDGQPFDALTKQAKAALLESGRTMSDKLFEESQLKDFINATSMKIVISATA